MSPTINDLWNGNICELEACGSLPHILQNENRLGAKIEKLRETLPDSHKKLFEQFLEAMYENNSDYAEAAFAHGLSLGIRLCSEAWTQKAT